MGRRWGEGRGRRLEEIARQGGGERGGVGEEVAAAERAEGWARGLLLACLAAWRRGVFKRGAELFLFLSAFVVSFSHLRVKCIVLVVKCHIVITQYLDASCNLSLNTPLLMLLLRLPSLPLKRPSSVYV